MEPAASSRRTPRTWFAPDLALSAAFVTAVFCLLLYDGGSRLFRDSDTGWHVRTGERILATGELPRADPYSWTRPGGPWFAWEWGSDAAMGAAHRWRGLTGVAVLYTTAIAAVTWLWFRLQWQLGGSFLLACAMASPMLSTVNLHWLARPHVFSWCLFLAWLLWLERRTEPFGWKHAAAAFGTGAVWANLHASFFLAPAVAIVFACGAAAERDRGASLRFVSAGAAAAVGSLCNPYGWDLHRHVFHYVTGAELLARIGEFQTFNFHSEGAAQILLTVLLCASAAGLALGQGNFRHALLLLAMTALGLRSARGLPMLALTLPFAAAIFTRAAGESAALRGALVYSANLRKIDAGLRGYALMPLLPLAIWAMASLPAVQRRTGFPGDRFPVEEAAAVAALPPGARLLAPDRFGGYLIYRFAGERKVFFDGRSDYYGIDFMKQYIDLVQVRPGWESALSRWNPDHALLPKDYSLLAALERAGWRRLHTGPAAVLLASPER